MSARFSPIVPACPDPRKPVTHVVASLLEPARVQPCYEGMDDTADYAQTLVARNVEPLEGMLHLECPEAV